MTSEDFPARTRAGKHTACHDVTNVGLPTDREPRTAIFRFLSRLAAIVCTVSRQRKGGGEEGEEAGEAERGEGVSAEGGIMSRFKYG